VIVTLLTDYGLEDEWAGVCHAVILAGCPGAQVVHLGHGVPAWDVRHGALALRNALPYVPVGVHVAVVDPGVGTERRAVAVRSDDGRALVGPDNGVLSLAWQRCGGALEAVDVGAAPQRLEPVSATFHGRDVFAPVAAALARGAALGDVGEPLDPASLTVLELPRARVVGAAMAAACLLCDRFGNLALAAERPDVERAGWSRGDALAVEAAGGIHRARYGRTFGDVERGGLLVHLDANDALALSVREGSAAVMLGVGRDALVHIFPA
jgi:S-adenosylmethionine hydrolase